MGKKIPWTDIAGGLLYVAIFVAIFALLCGLTVLLAGCAHKPALVAAGETDRLALLDAKIDTAVEATAGLHNDFANWFDNMQIDLDDRHREVLDVKEGTAELNRQLLEIGVAVGEVRQEIGKFQGVQNTGWFSGGGFWAALVAVAAFFLLVPSPLQRKRKVGGNP